MARITIIASGTRGDVQPAIALGSALQAAGDRVRIVAGTGFRSWIEAHGIEAAPSRVDMQAVMASPAGIAWVESGHRQLRQLRLMRAIVDEHIDDLIADAVDACDDADLVLSGFTSDAYALAIGERRGIPVASIPLQPTQLATRDGRAMTAAPFPDRVSRINAWFGRFLLEPFPWQLYGAGVNRFRRRAGLALQTSAQHVAARRRMPILHGVSRFVMPLPADWPPTCEVVGYWFLDDEPGWVAPPELEAFLADGPPPVLIGFGSMAGHDPAATASLALEAVTRSGVRAILLAGWGGLAPSGLPASVLALPEVPHGRILPRVAAIVHHGGAGTTAAAFRAGVPQVVVPHMVDQPYWGRRVRSLGCGPVPIPRHRLTAAGLAAAIGTAVSDAAMRGRAADVAGRIATERGPDVAVARLHALVRGRPFVPGGTAHRTLVEHAPVAQHRVRWGQRREAHRMDARLERIGRYAAVARGLEREGAYNGAKLIRAALARELVRYAEQAAPSGGEAAADALEALVRELGSEMAPGLADRLAPLAVAVRAGHTIALEDAPHVRVCRVCGELFLGDDVPATCPSCESPGLTFQEELPTWFLGPADRGAILAALAAGPRHLALALDDRPDTQLAVAPAPGEWSASQTLEHLLYAEQLLATRIRRLIEEDEPDLAAAAVWADTPASDEGSEHTGEPASVLATRIGELRHATVTRLAALDDAGWGRAGRHAEWGRVTVLAQAAYFARHEASHLAQLTAAAEGRLPGREATGGGAPTA